MVRNYHMHATCMLHISYPTCMLPTCGLSLPAHSDDGRAWTASPLAGCSGLENALHDAEVILLFNEYLKQ